MYKNADFFLLLTIVYAKICVNVFKTILPTHINNLPTHINNLPTHINNLPTHINNLATHIRENADFPRQKPRQLQIAGAKLEN